MCEFGALGSREHREREDLLPSSSSTWYCDAAPSSAMVVEQQSKSGWTKMSFGTQSREASLALGNPSKQRYGTAALIVPTPARDVDINFRVGSHE